MKEVDYSEEVDKICSDLKVMSMTNIFADRYVQMVLRGYDRADAAEAVLATVLDLTEELQDDLLKTKQKLH